MLTYNHPIPPENTRYGFFKERLEKLAAENSGASDDFEVTKDNEKRVRNSLYRAAKLAGIEQFIIRRIVELGSTKLRIWKVK